MHRFIFLTADGLSRGAIDAAVALALVLIWRGTRVLNFAQGAMAMLTTFIALSVINHSGSYWLGFVVALAVGLVLGGVVERVVVRRAEGASPLNLVIVTLGLLILLEAVAGMIYGNAVRAFPTPFSTRSFELGGTAVLSPFDLFVLGAVGLVLVATYVLFQYTDVGLRMRATAFAPEVSRLLGVRVGRMLTLSWALAALIGSLAGILVAPTVFVSPNYMEAVFVSGFLAAVVGGLDSPGGAVVGGIAVGLALSYAGGYLGSDSTDIVALALLLAVLLLRPNGLFSRSVARRV
jgi:branched-chain amino acid transport system permease protein